MLDGYLSVIVCRPIIVFDSNLSTLMEMTIVGLAKDFADVSATHCKFKDNSHSREFDGLFDVAIRSFSLFIRLIYAVQA